MSSTLVNHIKEWLFITGRGVGKSIPAVDAVRYTKLFMMPFRDKGGLPPVISTQVEELRFMQSAGMSKFS